MAGFFPVFFKSFWAAELTSVQSTFYLGLANSLSGLAIALFVLPLGKHADQNSSRKSQLMWITIFSCALTAGLFFVGKGNWVTAMALFTLSSLGFGLAIALYDSLLIGIAKPKDYDWISGVGYSLGYLGGGLLFLLNVAMAIKPEFFGFANAAQAVKWSFLSVALWWFVFSIPLYKWTPEPKGVRSTEFQLSFKQVWQALKANPKLLYFILAYVFYIDAVNTVIKMAVDYGSALGFESTDLIKALLLVQFVAFPAALFMSWLGEKIGAIKGIYICIAVYLLTCLFAQGMDSAQDFYLLAISIGLVQGGIQSLSRSHFAKFVPEEQASTYFAIFNLFGKFSAILGPALMGLVALATGSSRASLIVVVIFFFIGLSLLKISQSKDVAKF